MVFVRDVRSDQFHSDIDKLGGCDVVLGGFPCQGFSKAGPKVQSDERNTLYVEMKEVVGRLRPKLFIAENVDGLYQNFQGTYLKQIISDFRRVGYEVEHRVVDCAGYGVPQYRRRIFFVGYRQGCPYFDWPEPTHAPKPRNGEFKVESTGRSLFNWETHQPATRLAGAVPMRQAIGDILELDYSLPDHSVTGNWPEKYELVFRRIEEGQKLCNVRHAPTSVYTWEIPEVFGDVSPREVRILQTISRHRRHKQYGHIPNGNPLPVAEIERLSGLESVRREIGCLLEKGYLKELHGKYDLKGAMFCSGLFKRPRWGEPSPTILTNFHNPRYFLHPKRDRPFSLRECARLQGFADTFRFTSDKVSLIDGYRLVGNAVPPQLSLVFANAVLRFLDAMPRVAVAL
jgi:DNA (cytosine-5)-methyltransferase 1